MNKIVRKLTTKPVWWLETHRAYPIRDAWNELPPIPSPNGPVAFAVLTTPGTFKDALWAAWSWLRFLGDAVRLEVYVDGALTDDMRRSLDALLPGSGLFEAGRIVNEAGKFPPQLDAFIRAYPLGRKLGLLFALQQRRRVFYSDSDVLAFGRPLEIMEGLTSSGGGLYLCEEHEGVYASEMVTRARAMGLKPRDSLNSGLLLIAQNSLSLEVADELLGDWQSRMPNWFLEQTALACLLGAVPMTPLPRERYVLSATRQFYWQPDVDYSKIVARHFTGSTRHVMYGRAMPWVLRTAVGRKEA